MFGVSDFLNGDLNMQPVLDGFEYEFKHRGITDFKPTEFMCPCCNKIVLSTLLLHYLQLIRFDVEAPIIINSAYRCQKHNKAVNGSATSSHLKGVAVDIKMPNSEYRYKLLKAYYNNDLSIRRLGIYKEFIHIDIDTQKHNNIIFIGGY